ncbi:hypothetical protein [Crocinitomix catalasitica]|uniref:hypothetical protein n=1 Tax=Crocinitomix catalasitica TaxID=184607 RepID=UPI00048973E3|nr:hypothetical protein [Crocinitomix catalasitica]
MSFFKKLFGGSSAAEVTGSTINQKVNITQLPISFGRFSESSRSKEQLKYWTSSVAKYNTKNYYESYKDLLAYLKDEASDSIKVESNNGELNFELIQGSKKINGTAGPNGFTGEVKMVRMNEPNIAVMSKLMSINYALFYSKFAVDEDNIVVMKCSSKAIDGTPNKFYYAFQELAKKADLYDDLLLDEFSSLEAIDIDHQIPISRELQDKKYSFLINWINAEKEKIKALDFEKDAGKISFQLLYLAYKIDYLLTPHGTTTNKLERLQQLYFAKNNDSTQARNKGVIALFEEILKTSTERIKAGFYDVHATFSLNNIVDYKVVRDMIHNERKKIHGYLDKQHTTGIEEMYGYIFAYTLFNYRMIKPLEETFNLAMMVLNHDYYIAMGSEVALIDESGKLKAQTIINIINAIEMEARITHPKFSIHPASLKFTNKIQFLDSLAAALEIVDLNVK